MSNLQHSRERYDALLAAFRSLPGRYSAVAKNVGCAPLTAKRAWMYGWREYDWARPIKDVIADEQAAARALAAEKLERERNEDRTAEVRAKEQIAVQSKKDAAAERANELQAVRLAKTNATVLLASTAPLLRKANEIARMLEGEAVRNLSTREKAGVLKLIAQITREGNEAVANAVKLERLVAGEPTQITGHLHAYADVTPEEAAAIIERGNEAIARYKADNAGSEDTVIDAEYEERAS